MKRAAAAAVIALLALPLAAEPKSGIEYSPMSCVKGGELPLMQLKVEGKGELRAYFRKINTTDWCSVEGNNEGPLSRVVLPRFDPGDEIEYFFVLLEGRRVIARSPRIYRVKVTNECQAAWARHIVRFSLSCGDDAAGVPSSLGAGYAVESELIEGNPPYSSPDRPVPGLAERDQ